MEESRLEILKRIKTKVEALNEEYKIELNESGTPMLAISAETITATVMGIVFDEFGKRLEPIGGARVAVLNRHKITWYIH